MDGQRTKKLVALVPVPVALVAEIVPVVAPDGTVAVICVAEFTVKLAVVPWNVTRVTPVKLAPVIVTTVPVGPPAGVKLEMVGVLPTKKLPALVPVPPGVVTAIAPVVAPDGTVAVICVAEFTV